jgi:hypothetical protein
LSDSFFGVLKRKSTTSRPINYPSITRSFHRYTHAVHYSQDVRKVRPCALSPSKWLGMPGVTLEGCDACRGVVTYGGHTRGGRHFLPPPGYPWWLWTCWSFSWSQTSNVRLVNIRNSNGGFFVI